MVDPMLEETDLLLDMSDDKRYKYVNSILKWLGDSVQWIAGAEGKIIRNKRFQEFVKEARGRSESIITCTLWSIKPEYREVWMHLIGVLIGLGKEE